MSRAKSKALVWRGSDRGDKVADGEPQMPRVVRLKLVSLRLVAKLFQCESEVRESALERLGDLLVASYIDKRVRGHAFPPLTGT